ncbi:MAG: hypothetical protein V8R46_08510 [Eubacterium ramulus]
MVRLRPSRSYPLLTAAAIFPKHLPSEVDTISMDAILPPLITTFILIGPAKPVALP